jgi:hypothetical protein
MRKPLRYYHKNGLVRNHILEIHPSGILITLNFEEVISMTVSTQVKTCLASLKSAQASLETFALGTQNQEAKMLFENAAQSTQQIVDQVASRVQQMENEEPQYKGF